MAEPKGLGKKYATRTIAEELEWPLQKTLWDLIASLAQNPKVSGLDYLQIFDLQSVTSTPGFNQRITHRQEQPPYQANYQINVNKSIDAKIYVHVDIDTDAATMMFANEW
ncbi:DUF960 family protein [Alicyclobacillus dauci]|uniref:DUF960 domain-containing protein n=1 Tax=Alicyclobacillus dauci TaxID=1475485 RepID=A0ABY6Z9A7_9BACL|nr:DUF960 family protein [Alicyclobacillus dauci]WAH38841.1 DUF960 domain-containing protein [Alicyclobacillus dauci]